MKETTWPLQDAKNRLSELVDRAKAGIPQIITRRGKQEVVVVGIEDFKKISAREPDLVSFLRSSPLVGVDLQIDRDDDPGDQRGKVRRRGPVVAGPRAASAVNLRRIDHGKPRDQRRRRKRRRQTPGRGAGGRRARI